MRTKYTLYNTISSTSLYSLSILLGLINRKALICVLGIEYQGINGLFNNVISMLSIAELGIGSAIIYHLYKPLAECNWILVKSLMLFYKKCYLSIAACIAILGLCIVPFLGIIVPSSSIPLSLESIYLWYLLDVVGSYLFTYKRSIIIADQKNYLVTICDILYQLFTKLGQIIILFLTQNFMLYLVVMVIGRLGENILINYLAVKKYPILKSREVVPLPLSILKDIKQKVKGAVCHKIGSFIVMGTDNILISKFCGLALVGIYSNYQLMLSALSNLAAQICAAATASVGHLLVEEDNKKSFSVFLQMQVLNGMVITLASAGIYCIATPAIIWIFGEQYILEDKVLFVIAFNFFLTGMRRVYSIFKETAGILYEDRFIPLIESFINIIASLIFLHFLGMVGVFIGTIFSSLILFVYTYPILVYKKILGQSISSYYRQLLHLIGLSLINLFITKFFTMIIRFDHIIIQIVYNIIVVTVISLTIYYCFYARNKEETKLLCRRIKTIIKP